MKTFKDIRENFQDGRNPQDKGDMARHDLEDNDTSYQRLKPKCSCWCTGHCGSSCMTDGCDCNECQCDDCLDKKESE